jgi:hypothetical protein
MRAMEDLTILCDRIRLLAERRPAARADDVEHTLTDGYAKALALESERLRARERMHALAGSADHLEELRALKGRLERLDEQVAELRGLLGALAGTL